VVPVTPVDLTPPAPPRDLVAIPSEGAVRLSWQPSPDADVALYIVYRAAGGGALQRVGSVPPPGTTFVDREVARGTYRYAVTAQDSGVRANEGGRSNEVTVTVP
jgi:penicillin-binding protein